MVNMIITKNIILVLFLIYSERIRCILKDVNNDNSFFLRMSNETDVANKIIIENSIEKSLINKFIDSEIENFNLNQIHKLNERYKADLNLRETLKLEYMNLKTKEIENSSFMEIISNAEGSDFLSIKSKPFKWINITVAGKKPSPRKDYSVILADSYLVIFGGCSKDNNFSNELYFYDILGQTWLEVKQYGKVPSARCGHIAKLYGSVMWVFGGYSREGYLNDLYSLNLETVIIEDILIKLCLNYM